MWRLKHNLWCWRLILTSVTHVVMTIGPLKGSHSTGKWDEEKEDEENLQSIDLRFFDAGKNRCLSCHVASNFVVNCCRICGSQLVCPARPCPPLLDMDLLPKAKVTTLSDWMTLRSLFSSLHSISGKPHPLPLGFPSLRWEGRLGRRTDDVTMNQRLPLNEPICFTRS